MPNIIEWQKKVLVFTRAWLDNEDISALQRELGKIKKKNNAKIANAFLKGVKKW